MLRLSFVAVLLAALPATSFAQNPPTPPTGFTAIFNGQDLTGWKGLVGNPITRAKMSESELATKQKEANAKAAKNWSVKDNSIVFNGAGDNLCSEKQYGDFEMIVDWRITKKETAEFTSGALPRFKYGILPELRWVPR